MNKQALIFGLLLAGATLPGFAAEPMAGMNMQEKSAHPTHHGNGKVIAVNRAKRLIKLEHGPIKSLGWPGMTMNFGVEDATLLDGLNVGDAVKFELKQAKPKKWEIIKIERE